MAKLTKFLGQVVGGIFGSEGDMRDHQHAARLFTDNYYALSPKVEFLYHVYFDINDAAKRAPGANSGFSKQQPNIECGMLVKSCSIPGVQVQTETKNQYGKKTNVQTQVQYTPINITFHDDNANLISGMWQQYFKTYYADSNYPDELARQPTYNSPGRSKGQQQRSNAQEGQMTPTTATKQTNRSFGFNDFQTGHFFNRISIYQLARQRFFEYTLINPIIQSWQGPQLNSSSSNPAENQMTLIYEGIKYAEGNITRSQPDGFAQLHYDTTPSPLSLMGGGTASLFGSTGVLAGGLDVFGDIAGIASGQVTNPFAIIGTAIKAKNTLDNAKQLTKDGIRNEIVNVAVGATLNTVEQTVRIEGLNKVNQTKATPVEGDNQVVSDPKLIQNQVDNDAQSTVITGEGEAPVPVTT